ncbi:MAG: DUF86 domain-containing protein [Candidatus Brocadiaceae bacterium]|nr:DUF86 domain-containing protein [Candidatus Brocadiaceae bacterium]
MQRDDNVYLGHMLDTARKARSRVEGKSRSDYDDDEDLRIVVAHLVQTIGEAAARVSASMRQAHPEIPWKQITGIRHRIVHDYMDTDYDVLWEVAVRDLPDLIRTLEPMVPPEGGEQ